MWCKCVGAGGAAGGGAVGAADGAVAAGVIAAWVTVAGVWAPSQRAPWSAEQSPAAPIMIRIRSMRAAATLMRAATLTAVTDIRRPITRARIGDFSVVAGPTGFASCYVL